MLFSQRFLYLYFTIFSLFCTVLDGFSFAESGVSDFVRTLALSDKKILVLAAGSEIARSMVQIHIELQNAQKNGVLSNKYTLSLLQSMEELIEAFNAVSEQLTDIRSNDEEDA